MRTTRCLPPPSIVIPSKPQTVTRLLGDIRAGEESAVHELFPLVYEELRVLARACFGGERSGHTLQPTAVINEAWLKLSGGVDQIEDRHHFFALASRAMRQVLTDHARASKRMKRGGGAHRVTLDEQLHGACSRSLDLIELDDTLERLASLNERHAKMVELRIFGGLTIPETAEALGVSHGTVERDWFTARAWLRRELGA